VLLSSRHFHIAFCTLNPLSSEEYLILKWYDLKAASIVDGVLRRFSSLPFDGDDRAFGMFNAELAHCAHENPTSSNNNKPFRLGASKISHGFSRSRASLMNIILRFI